MAQFSGLMHCQAELLGVRNGVAHSYLLLTQQGSRFQVLPRDLLSSVALVGGVGGTCTLDHWLL